MRNPAAAHIYGHGKSRSKPLCRKSMRNILIQHRGSLKLQKLFDKVIKKTAPVRLIKLSKLSLGIKKGIHTAMKNAAKIVPKKKLNINVGLKK